PEEEVSAPLPLQMQALLLLQLTSSCSSLSLSLPRRTERTGAQRRPVEGALQCCGRRSHEEGCAERPNAQRGEYRFHLLDYFPTIRFLLPLRLANLNHLHLQVGENARQLPAWGRVD